MLPMQGTQVPSLVQELRSHMPCGVAKKKKKKMHSLVNLIEALALLGTDVVFIEYLRIFYCKSLREEKSLQPPDPCCIC